MIGLIRHVKENAGLVIYIAMAAVGKEQIDSQEQGSDEANPVRSP